MSWFDASGIATLAKSALKEAQKTIDKALDIKDEDQKEVPAPTEDTSDFFATWGLKNDKDEPSREKCEDHKPEISNSIWGSFTGSFFETSKLGDSNSSKRIPQSKSMQNTPVENVRKTRLTSSLSLPEDCVSSEKIPLSEGLEKSETKKNVNKESSKTASTESINLDVSESSDNGCVDVEQNIRKDTSESMESFGEPDTVGIKDPGEICDNIKIGSMDDIKEIMEQGPNTNSALNRISIISSGSDKKSLESVEVLGSCSNTDCATTPESDGNSGSNSVSPSAADPKVNSESVEILTDSLVTSPSSVEILGDWKSDSSPYLSPMDNRNITSPTSPMDREEESVTPCCEEENAADFTSSGITISAWSSDISPYESPSDELQMINSTSYTSSIDDNPSSAGTYTAPHLSRSCSTEPNPKTSPDSVEVIPDVDEFDEASLAEDSYTSASESTVMTALETLQQYDQAKGKAEVTAMIGKMHESCPDGRQQTPSKMCPDTPLNLSLDSLKEKHNLHLRLEAITTQPIRKMDYPESSTTLRGEVGNLERLMSATIEPSDPEPSCPDSSRTEKQDVTESTDQYLISTDSSCEGTLIESSSEENPSLLCKAEEQILEAPLTASSYVKNMLADAMVEKSEVVTTTEGHVGDTPRDNSPISSESRSDLVKIGSDQTSGHTSGDELETTTSSDIEIISSPNGDSSSTQSRHSPAKLQPVKGTDLLTKTLKTRGHSRELSEISVGSDENTNFEIEKLLKRVQEMTEILEARESKLIDVSRMNMELNEQNNTLKKQLDSMEKHAEQSQNLNQITDEYTQRLSALERKFQQAIRERDSLRKSLEHLKVEAAARLSSQELSNMNAEKDEIIRELREEGEKLSKQQLQHSNIIKKLRAKEKEANTITKNQKEQIEELNSELERLKRTLHAKEEVERTQIEAVHTLTAKTKKQEKEILTLQEKLDNTIFKMDAYKTSLDAAKLDLSETKKILVTTEAELKDVATHAGESCQLLAEVEELKSKLRQSEETHAKKEDFLKHENADLLKRLEAAEARSEELSESVSMATKPLLRQLEQLQANLMHKSNSYAKQEKILSEKNVELQTKLGNLIEVERYLREENINLKSKVSQLESRITAKEAEESQWRSSYEEIAAQSETLVQQNARFQQTIDTLEQSYSSQIKELKREISALESKLAIEKAATDAEKRKNQAILEQQESIDELRLSPTTTASMEQESVSSVNNIWPVLNDSFLDNNSGRYTMVYDSVRAGSSSSSIFENLQSQLKQRDGEIQQLQWELSRRNTERDALNMELSALTSKVEALNNKVLETQLLQENLNEIQTRYDALLQMYGEKMEENQELKLDLEDVKEMYKTQIDQLLKRDT